MHILVFNQVQKGVDDVRRITKKYFGYSITHQFLLGLFLVQQDKNNIN